MHSDKIFLTPDSMTWDPYSDHFAQNEESMIDYEGNMVESRYRKRYKSNEYEICSISLEQYEAKVDECISKSDAWCDTTWEYKSSIQEEAAAVADKIMQ